MSDILNFNCPKCGFYNPWEYEYCRRCNLKIRAKHPPPGSDLGKVMEFAFNNTILDYQNRTKYPNNINKSQDFTQNQNIRKKSGKKEKEKENGLVCKSCNKKNSLNGNDFCMYCGTHF